MPAGPRKVYHISYDEKEEGWVVRSERGRRVAGPYGSKPEALAEAKRRVKAAPFAQIVIHDRHGRIQTEHTYGRDSRRRRG